MTVQTTKTVVQYQGDGSSVSFPFSFQVLEGDHIDVFLVNNNTNSSVQGIAAGSIEKLDPAKFDVTVNQNAPGGTVKFTGQSAPTADITVTIERSTPKTQQTNYVPNDPFPAESHERALDKLTLLVQEVCDEIDNGGFISTPPGEDPDCPPLPTAEQRAGKFLTFTTKGCPTVTDLTGTGDIVAPTLLSDLSNVSAGNATDRQVISLNTTTGEWTPEDNVFSLNDQSGDLTIGTNGNGDITVTDGQGNTTTVVDSQDVAGGPALLKDFTAAESGVKGDLLAIRSNAEVELIQETTSSGGELDIATYVSRFVETRDTTYNPDKKVHVVLYNDDADKTTLYARLFDVDAQNEQIGTVGVETQIATFTNGISFSDVTVQVDTVNDRIVIMMADPDNNANDGNSLPIGYVLEADWVNFAITTVGSKQTFPTQPGIAGSPQAGSGFSPDQAVHLYAYGTGPDLAAIAYKVDPSNNTLSTGNSISKSDGLQKNSVRKEIPWSSPNGVFLVGYSANGGINGKVFAVQPSGTNLTAGTKLAVNVSISNIAIFWDDENDYGILIYNDNDNNKFRGALLNVSGLTVTFEDDRELYTDKITFGQSYANNGPNWFLSSKIPTSAGNGAAPAVIAGDVNPDVPKVVLIDANNRFSSDPTKLKAVLGPDDSINISEPSFITYDNELGAVVMAGTDPGNSEGVIALGTAPSLTSNRNQWIGVATEDFSAGDDVTVALRGSEAFINTNTTFQPGDFLFVDNQGQVQTSGTFQIGIATKADERLLTAGLGTGQQTTASSSTASSVDEELLSTQDITSNVPEITVNLPSGFVAHKIEILELQSELASPGQLFAQLSDDGGATYISSNDYSNGSYNLKTNASEALMGENNNTDRWTLDSPQFQTGSNKAANIRMEIWSADNSSLYTNHFSLQQYNDPGGADWLNNSGILAIAEKHNAIKFFLDGGDIARARVRVKGLK